MTKANYIDLTMDEWQIKNCKDCYFAEAKKVGTGNPCCTYPGSLVHDLLGHCKSKRLGKPRI